MNTTHITKQKRKLSPTIDELQAKVTKLEEALINVRRIAISSTKQLIHDLETTSYFGAIDTLVKEGKFSSREDWETKNPIATLIYYEFNYIFNMIEMDIDACIGRLDLDINKPYQSQETFYSDADSNSNSNSDSDSDYVPSESSSSFSLASSVLAGWSFKMNTTTFNSFILSPNVPVKQLKLNKETKLVTWSSGSMPAACSLFYDELDRNVFYVDLYKGWIVSLRLEDKMIQMGATRAS